MYNAHLEFFGLGLFFVVNAMYSAMLGMDISSYILNVFSGIQGAENSSRWVLFLVGILIVALSMNFTSSILTVMTMSNLHSKFSAKGEPILLSPDNRKQLSTIEGLFVASIVLITVLSFRIYFTPAKMAENLFSSVSNNVSGKIVNWGHFLVCLVVFALGISVWSVIQNMNATNTKLPPAFVHLFQYLLVALASIVFIYVFPLIAPIFEILLQMIGINIHLKDLYVTQQISAYTLFKILIVPLTLWLSSQIYNAEVNLLPDEINIALLGIISMSLFLGTSMLNIIGLIQPSIAIGIEHLIAIAGLIGVIVFNVNLQKEKYISEKTQKMKHDLATGNITLEDHTFMELNGVSGLLLLFPIVIGLLHWIYYQTHPSGLGITTTLFKHIGVTSYDFVSNIHKVGLLNTVDTFMVMKTFLICLSIVIAGFTANSYSKIPISKFTLSTGDKGEVTYYRLKELFLSFFVLLMIVLSMSLIHVNHMPMLFTVIIDYVSPVAVLIILSVLVYLSNHMSQLSNKEVIDDVTSPKKSSEPPNRTEISKDQIRPAVFDGITHKI
jgi:Na+-transporting methylmalonyl-CoA/oxaloacetate decarboxylase gamma subunit